MRIAAISATAVILAAGAVYAQPPAAPAPAAAAPAAPPAAPASPAAAALATAKPVTTAPVDSTLGQIITKGMTMNLADMEFVFSFKPADGTFETAAFAGKYWVEATRLCFDIPDVGYNACSEYPAGKKSGDKFGIETANGAADVKIN